MIPAAAAAADLVRRDGRRHPGGGRWRCRCWPPRGRPGTWSSRRAATLAARANAGPARTASKTQTPMRLLRWGFRMAAWCRGATTFMAGRGTQPPPGSARTSDPPRVPSRRTGPAMAARSCRGVIRRKAARDAPQPPASVPTSDPPGVPLRRTGLPMAASCPGGAYASAVSQPQGSGRTSDLPGIRSPRFGRLMAASCRGATPGQEVATPWELRPALATRSARCLTT